MAEGVESKTANLGNKYFCHQCFQEVCPIPYNPSELMCPECSSGFLEEIIDTREHPGRRFQRYLNFLDIVPDDEPVDSSVTETVSDDEEEEDGGFSDPVAESREPDVEAIREFRRSLLAAAEEEEEFRELENFVPIFQEASLDPFLDISSNNVYDFNFMDAYNLEDEVDDLASQLLDQVEISGPPPLTKEQIKALPLVTLSTEHQLKGLQCTICMSDFKLEDTAKKLTCEHLFHEECITPWLEKQASCPNCRDKVIVETKSKRSSSCPRTFDCPLRPRNTSSAERRFSEVSPLGDFFTVSMNPFRFL